MAVVIETTIGDFTVDLYTEERPQTCRNFLKLCKIKYYNWNLFFTVQSNFIAQTGDPSATGEGGMSIYGVVLGEKARFYEAEKLPKLKHDKVGLISMVNCGDNMLGSQFFITLAPDLQSLDGEHCVFGEITEGLEIILKFNETICDTDHRPYQDVRISHTVILEDPYDDPKDLRIPDRSPSPTKEALMSDRIGADEIIDDTAGMTEAEVIEMQKEKEAKARATILEIVGDIPDADMAPPENVLFVCKLNPVTSDDDLEIIFSRFGKIVSCEVIRDKQTGDSLQYAFIEFSDRKSCEDAYFKMDNVLIDDRRIHVDFSQSVAKMRWRGKGKGIIYYDDNGKINKDEMPNDRRNKKVRQRSRSRSPRKDRYENRKDRDENRGRYDSKKDYKRRQESYRNEDDRRRGVREEKQSKKRLDRSRSKEKREKSRERVRERREIKDICKDRRDKSKDKKDRKRDSRNSRDEKHKKKLRDSSSSSEEERNDRHSGKRRKSKERSEEKYSSKRRHKHRS
ncbi:peptidyl-prolyl cis-trans isomerase sig-7 isoform X1 [Copidosoma floridanum]|uniref:peptidyl-prolyl cis-trans isomerase sig-7 isoform X1 n=3 Tax=Copidosoma floridanum TaxID=29053 RepID=UPI000C6FB805|nr:peptidyl-prolyl cis-trans isomerase sig-7 isoform X1 [Copidosoma floridanum]